MCGVTPQDLFLPVFSHELNESEGYEADWNTDRDRKQFRMMCGPTIEEIHPY